MKELFVNYEIALKLKQLKFDKPCFAYYEVSDKLKDGYRLRYVEHEDTNPLHQSIKNDNILAPIYQQVVDWFLSKHNIYITALFYSILDENYQVITGYKPYIINVKKRINLIARDEKYNKKINGGLLSGNGITFDTPQNAIEEGITYCLNKIK